MKILITGTTGALGDNLVHTLLAQFDVPLYCVFRTRRSYEQYVSNPNIAPWQSRIIPVIWDLTQPAPESQTHDFKASDRLFVVHCAANVSWVSSLDESSVINMQGTMHVANFVKKVACDSTFIYISSAATHREKKRFNTSYEQTKALADVALRTQFQHDFKVYTISPSLIVGHSQTGYIATFKSIYPVLRVMSTYQPPVLIADRHFKVDIVPCDWVVNEIIAIMNHQAVSDDIVCTLGIQRAPRVSTMMGIFQQQINQRLAAKGIMPSKAPWVLSRKEYQWLDKINTVIPLYNKAKLVKERVIRVMEPYTQYSESGAIREPQGTATALPAYPKDFLSVNAQFWLRHHHVTKAAQTHKTMIGSPSLVAGHAR